MHAIVSVLLLIAVPSVAAAQYCLLDDSGGRSCGIPTLQQCEQSLIGVGGSCAVDDSAQLGAPIPGIFQSLGPLERRIEGAEDSQDYQKPSSPALDDVPPPPGN
jgi:hypothetical protein